MVPRRANSSDAAERLLDWLEAAGDAVPLGADLVHGAAEEERRKLSALGAVARALVPDGVPRWPETLRSWAQGYGGELDERLRDDLIGVLAQDADDVLAQVYERVVSGRNRRRLGTFFTPTPIVDHMIATAGALGPAPDHVVDPGAGVGAFALAAGRAWPQAMVSAVDVNVVTLGLLAARTATTAAPRPSAQDPNFVSDDFLVWLEHGWNELRGRRLMLGNPPYTRHQLMTTKDKLLAQAAAGDLISSGLAGLSTYFLAATINALSDADALCLLLPSSWCETRYGRELRAWLWSARHRRVELHRFPSRVAVFPGTQVMAMVLAVGPRRDDEQDLVVEDVDLPGEPGGTVVRRQRRAVKRRGPCPTAFVALGTTAPTTRHGWQRFGEHVKIRRGLVTGASSSFFLTVEQCRQHALPASVLRRAVVRPRHILSPCLTEEEHEALLADGLPGWLLDLNGYSVNAQGPVGAYLDKLKRDGTHLGVLAGRRNPWYVVERVASPDLLFVPVSYGVHRVIENEVHAIGSNNFFGLSVRTGSPWTTRTLADWLRSDEGQGALRGIARHYQGGSLKVEPGALRDLRVPPRSLEVDR